MKQSAKSTVIAFCDYPTTSSMTPKSWGSNGLDITIGVLGDDGKPRNASRGTIDPILYGGFRFHVYPSEATSYSPAELRGWWTGPQLHESDPEPYVHAARGMTKLKSKISSYYPTRGNAVDGVEDLLRWLEAAGITSIYVRPNGSREEWMGKGEWLQWNPVELAASIRAYFHEATKSQAA